MNWVGGVTTPNAAQSLLGQGGIPNVALVSGGTVKSIRMEHVWVEAYVDNSPCRGAVNKLPTTWIPVDASFKQYQFTQGMDIKRNTQANAQNFLDQIKQDATVNETEEWTQNLSQANLQPRMTAYQNQVKAYVETQKANATVGDVLGTQTVIEQSHGILLGSLPYRTVATGDRFQALPDRLKWKFKTNIYEGGWYGESSSPIIEVNQSTAKLAGKKITLSFIPATPADQDLINSYLPKPHPDGTPIQASELPSSLPGYLLRMKAEFRVDGQVVAQSSQSFTLGSDVKQANQYFNPAYGTWDGGEDNDITVGEYNAIGIDLQGIGAKQLADLQNRLRATKAKLTQFLKFPNDPTPINGLTKEDLGGDVVHSGILGYFARVDSSDRLIARMSGDIKTYRLPSYGRFVTAAQSHYFFGVVKRVTFPGVMMDVDYLSYQVSSTDGSKASSAQFMRQAGAAGSSAESALPEEMFRNPDLAVNDPAQPQGISAVKALAIAAAQGQKIYTLNQKNSALHNAILQGLQISQDVKSEISSALFAGKEVTVHEKDINVNGWTGNGYILLDQATGAGAYKIAGGANGGLLFVWIFIAIALIAVLAASVFALPGIIGLASYAIGGAIIASVFVDWDNVEFDKTAFIDWGGLTLAALGVVAAIGTAGLLPAILGLLFALAAVINDFPK